MSRLSEFSDELENLVAAAAPSVVAVEHGRGQGSGIVVSSDGYVITNAHVVQGREKALSVRLAGGEELPAEVVGEDRPSDIAVLRVASHGLASLALDESRRLRVGQLVLAIGNPLRFERSVSLGVVSAIDRSLPGPGRRPFEGLVQTDAAINPGNSGGPLLDARGAVVGINTAVIPRANGLGFAIPAHTAAWVAAVLIRDGRVERPLLGIAAQGVDLTPRVAEEVGQQRAVRVHAVAADSPASAAQLQPADLLLGANQTALYSVDDLQRVLVLARGTDVALRVMRDGQALFVSVRAELTHKAA
ncbi:MAG TPA: trypsin-like peptidase domain-containing protein [Polyangiaceae bacterium]|jgi:S1-C subfamily serine protease|nr:trypsin-like peptidase domain-containing protein [Polyangiaceae bacterium]